MFEKILIFFDKKYWDRKWDETNWNYDGLILDSYFDNSVLSVDYLDINDYFESNGGFSFSETELLVDQYGNIEADKYLLVVQNLLNIIHCSDIEKEINKQVVTRITNVLKREGIKSIVLEFGGLLLESIGIIDAGSYCNITYFAEGVLRKELKQEYQDDKDQKKRMRYEFENMKKLSSCPQILKVIDFDDETHSYTMEQGDMNLFVYLSTEIEISFEERIKIINDILAGMAYAHNNFIIHRDLHLGNVLKIGVDFVLCDFGLSKDTSIIRSLKSSNSEKNNHIFVDPLGINDFTKLDDKSDIYSIGIMIDYILTKNETSSNHPLKSIVERCIAREKTRRYKSVDDIIVDVSLALEHLNGQLKRELIIEHVLNNDYNSITHDFVLDLAREAKLCSFIVKHRLREFGKLATQFDNLNQNQIFKSIEDGYSEATGYGGWENYDLFSEIAYYTYNNTQEVNLQNKCKRILEGCSVVRFSAQKLLNRINL